MKALILAAGLGSRLKENTNKIPKALVKINNYPILHYQLNALNKVGIDQIIVVIGYKGEQIKRFINENHNNFTVKYIENKKFSSSNSSYSFWLAKNYILNEPYYIHLNCDIIFSHSLLESLINSKYDNVIAVRSDLELHNNMENVILREKRIIDMSLINSPKANGKAFGLAKLSASSTSLLIKKLNTFINSNDLNQNYYGMIRLAVKDLKYYAIKTNRNNILEVNTVEDLSRAKEILYRKIQL